MSMFLHSLCCSWHQTPLISLQYFHHSCCNFLIFFACSRYNATASTISNHQNTDFFFRTSIDHIAQCAAIQYCNGIIIACLIVVIADDKIFARSIVNDQFNGFIHWIFFHCTFVFVKNGTSIEHENYFIRFNIMKALKWEIMSLKKNLDKDADNSIVKFVYAFKFHIMLIIVYKQCDHYDFRNICFSSTLLITPAF